MLLPGTVRETKGAESQDLSRTRINADILRGIHLLYDEQFEAAENVFLKVVSQSVEKPDGYFYLAMVIWSRLASGFWTPEAVEEFRKRIDRAIQVARKRIEGNTFDSYDYFFLGGALGFRGRFELMRGNWLSSFFLAKEAISALNTCLKMDPGNKDVLLGLGTFDYYTAHLTGVLKFLTYLLLHEGNKDEGLRKLHVAAEEAIYSATESKSMLLHIYLFLEKDFKKALPLAEYLAKRYEHNPRYRFLKGVSYIGLGMDLQYRVTVNDFRRRSRRSPMPERGSVWGRRALYLETSHDLHYGQYSEARKKIGIILSQSDPENDPAMIAWPLMKMGMSYELEGHRGKAIEYYDQVLNMKNGSGAQFLAKKLLSDHLKKNDPFIRY